MDTSTLLVMFLLVTAASLASYALSHWRSLRGALGLSWAATSVGTTMLLVAAAIVVLTFVFRGPLWRPSLGTEQQLRETAATSKDISARPLVASALPIAAASPASATASRTARAAGQLYAAADPPVSTGNKQQPRQAAMTPSTTELDPEPLRAFKEDNPWAATGCVYVYNPGSDTTRWKIDNGCEVPVGVAIHPDRSLILPAPAQRPVTLDEQTVHAASVRHTACFVATSKARALIGAPSEERSTPAWREQFEAARVNDGCLLRLQGGNN